MINENYFDESRFATLCYFDSGRDSYMRREPLIADSEGNVTCAPLKNGRWQLGFEWEMPRDISGVKIRFADSFDTGIIKEEYIEYWQSCWPYENPNRRAGAKRGWLGVDDCFNGRWCEAYGDITFNGNESLALFDHIDQTETCGFSGAMYSSEDYNADYRRTLKMRVIFISDIPPVISGYSLIGNAKTVTKECEIHIAATGQTDALSFSCGDISIWNGKIREIKKDQSCIKLAYTATEGAKCQGDDTLIQINSEKYPFSVNAADIDAGVYMEDFDLLICSPLAKLSPAEKVRELTEGKSSIYDRASSHAEQSVKNAFDEIPEMDVTLQPPYGRYVILGLEGLRKKFCLRYNGDIFADKDLQKSAMRDLCGTRWAGCQLHFRISTGDPPSRREEKNACRQYLPDAEIPVYVTEWLDRDIEYRQTTFATVTDCGLTESVNLRGDEDIVVMNRVEIRNTTAHPLTAKLFIDLYPCENLAIKENALISKGRVAPDDSVSYGWTVQDYPREYTRLTFKKEKGTLSCIPMITGGIVSGNMVPGERDTLYFYDGQKFAPVVSSSIPGAMLYEVKLEGHGSAKIDFNIPYNTPIGKKQTDRIAAKDFDTEKRAISEYWRAFYLKAAHISLPDEKQLNDFIKAVPWHIAMTAVRDPKTGNYIVPAGTYAYGACGNEACMQIKLFDYLGYGDYSKRYLDTYIDSQGRIGLDGNFKSREGALIAINYERRQFEGEMLDQSLAYNLDHGYILSCFCDHYFLTGDRDWMKNVAKTVIDGCDFVFREREATKLFDGDGNKVSFYGLLPHGHLEDNHEWRCWFAVNAHVCGGILRAARALSDICHPDAERILDEGIKYRDDIRAALIRAMAKSPAVPSGRGGYIPHIPTHAEIRGRDLGWFREAAYGPLHLVYGMVLDPNEQLTSWILNDLEDNLFISRDWGRIADRDKDWFSRGGVTIQSNLLFNDLVYLQRGESEMAVRALFNNFAQNLYRDISCFSEHPVAEFGRGVGPFFKTPDEAQFLIFLRNHLVAEREKGLDFLKGAPRLWFAKDKSIEFERLVTEYGIVSLKTAASENVITAEINARWKKSPENITIYLRREDKKAPSRVKVNGKELDSGCIAGDTVVIVSPGEKFSVSAEY